MATELRAQPTFCLGTSEDGDEPIAVNLSEDLFATHFAILGGTGTGKSKLIELFCRQAITNGCGLCLLDPHSTTADDILGNFAHLDNDGLIAPEDVFYLNPSLRPFSYDPFVYHPSPEIDPADETYYHSWLSAKVQDMVKIILRKQGETEEDQEKMVRLGTWLRNGLYGVGVRHDVAGTHLPMTDIFAIINPLHPRHEEVYGQVRRHLPEDMVADFEMLRSMPRNRPDSLQHFIESTMNRLRAFMAPVIREVFSGKAPPIDFHEIVRNNGVILAALGKSEHFHEEWGQIIGGLILREISSAVRTIPAAEHNQFYLIMDEAQNYLNDDIKGLLRESRKYGLSVGMAVQSLDNLRKGDVDLSDTVLGQSGIRITFQQQRHEHALELAKDMRYDVLDFTELTHEADRDDGYDWYFVPSYSQGQSEGTTISVSRGENHSRSKVRTWNTGTTTQLAESAGTSGVDTDTETVAFGTQNSRSRQVARNESETEGETTARGGSEQESEGDSRQDGSVSGTTAGRSVRLDGNVTTSTSGESLNASRTLGRTHGFSSGKNWNRSIMKNYSRGIAVTNGDTEGRSRQVSGGHAQSRGQTESVTKTGGQSESAGGSTGETHGTSKTEGIARSVTANQSITWSLTPIKKTRVEVQQTGSFVTAIPDQHLIEATEIQRLAPQHCLISIGKLACSHFLRIDDVIDPIQNDPGYSDELRELEIKRLKDRIFSAHACYITKSPRQSTGDGKDASPDDGQVEGEQPLVQPDLFR